jgi:hypothetical protein
MQTRQPSQAKEVCLSREFDDESKEVHLSVSTSLPDTPDKREVLVCVEDITKRKEAEKQIQANLNAQEVTNGILRLALESASREDFLRDALDLLISIPWLRLQGKGCVFLARSGAQSMEMVADRNLPQELLSACGTLPVGKCLCGKAAKSRKIVYAGDVDDRHEIKYPGMLSQGHYCVPIASDNRLYGVLNLYVAAGHQRTDEEEAFLGSVAGILALSLHPPGLVLDSSGEVKASLQERNMPLAILPQVDFVLGGPLHLATGDLVLFFTDGLIEAQPEGGTMFGLQRMLQVVRDNRHETAAAIIDALYDEVSRHMASEGLHDDVTVVVVKVD